MTHMNASLQSAAPPVPTDLDRVKILSEALPYLQQFRGRTIVVKYGGAAMKDPTLKEGVIKDLVCHPQCTLPGGPLGVSCHRKVQIAAYSVTLVL